MTRLLTLAVLGVFASPVLSQTAAHAKPAAQAITFTVDTAQSSIDWTLSATAHTVHGAFIVQRGEFRLGPNPGQAAGELTADATSGKTGNDGRDKKMHADVLESAKFPMIMFRLKSAEGPLPTESITSLTLRGTISIHGTNHDVSVPVQAQLSNGHWTGTGAFTVPYVDWGLKNPSNFFLRVGNSVDVSIALAGSIRQ